MKKPSKLYAAAVHEAGHAQVGLALGMKFAKHEAICCKRGTGLTVYELAILDGKSQPIAHVRPLRFTGHSPVSRAAFDLAGGIAKYRVTQGDPGIVSDAAQAERSCTRQERPRIQWRTNRIHEDRNPLCAHRLQGREQ